VFRMRKDFQVAILLAVAAMPTGVAMMAAPYYAEAALKAYAGPFFWGGLILAAVFICVAIAIAIRGEATEPRGGHGRRMVALAGMIVCGAGFLGFVAAYFWPSPVSLAGASTAVAPVAPNSPDVTLRFVYPTSPALVLVNESSVVARSIKWTVVLWNLDDPRTYANPAPIPDAHDPLPIPVSTFDFLRPGTTGGPQGLFNTPLVRPHVKEGQRLFGSASVICPECERGHTYIVSIVFGRGGWYTEVLDWKEGEMATPKKFTKDGVEEYYKNLLSRVPEANRIPITGEHGGEGVTNPPAVAPPSPEPPK
jgi:hypothetical protein